MTGKELKKLREKRGITQERLAGEIGVGYRQTVYRWEKTGIISKVYQRILNDYFNK